MTRNKNHNPATLERTLGSTAAIRILDQLTLSKDYDYSKQDIAKNSDLSFPHTLKTLATLEENKLITKTRNIGNAQLYKLNTNNPAVQHLLKFKFELMCQQATRSAQQEQTKEQQTQTTAIQTPQEIPA